MQLHDERGRWAEGPDARTRFMAKVRKGSTDADCWIWTAGTRTNGYGQFYLHGADTQAHRTAWLIFKGPIPDGLYVCHHCDVRLCVNPAHLFLGTGTDNQLDCSSKGRCFLQRYPERSPTRKLTEAQVREIMSLKGQQSGCALGRKFGVSDHSIYSIWNGSKWRHLALTPVASQNRD